MNVIESIIGVARRHQYLQASLQDAIFKDHPLVGMAQLGCCPGCHLPGIVTAKAEGDQLDLVEERFEQEGGKTAILPPETGL